MNKFKKWFYMLLGLSEPVLAVGQLPVPNMNVTSGAATIYDNTIYIESASSRISFPQSSGEGLYIKAKYLGPSDDTSAFASGAVVEQVGIKLREINTCNLVYIMRRIKPTSNVSILVKSNPGLITHQECGDKGYTHITAVPLPEVFPGDEITLSAKYYDNNTLVVWCNGQKIYGGPAPFNSTGIGSAGVRTDNVRTSIRLFE